MLSLFLSFRLRAYWARCLPGPLASPVPVLVVDFELLKINHFRRRMHQTGILSVVTSLPMLISCLPFPTYEHETHDPSMLIVSLRTTDPRPIFRAHWRRRRDVSTEPVRAAGP
jgi:hypothetical protein